MTELTTELTRPRGRYGVDGDYRVIPAPVISAAICCYALPQRFSRARCW